MSLLVVGTVAFDGLETPFGIRERILGGSATYIGISAGYFVDRINLVSVVGEDFPQAHIDLLNAHNVHTEGLQVIKGQKTFFWKGKYHLDMNSRDTLETQLNVLEHFDPIIPESYMDCQYLMLGNLVPAIQMRVLEQLPNRPKLVVLDTMNLWMDAALEDLKKVLTKVDVLTINDEEARQLSGEHNLVQAAKKIQGMGPKTLIIKKGEHGALLFGADGNIFFAPALPLAEVLDPTGAGDTFAGGFMGYLAQTDDISFDNMKRALMYAATMASFCVEKFGPERLEHISAEEMAARRAQFTQLSHVQA
ncbi:MAG: PfkB family carbohydrate kinase [Cryomorphaceae bacterium]|jgi:sugar/nucleoside kinase (ribokinase family)|nr:MAG: sugar kinase [Cryomorphaceae bacterium BACL7 MAG-121220-bin83]|tara:strand:+ start:141 stop:1058 length:918 start_codon:yes stop_codon:yes gene_type:complete